MRRDLIVTVATVVTVGAALAALDVTGEGELRGEMGQLRGEMGQLRGEMGQLRGDMGERLARIEERLDLLIERSGLFHPPPEKDAKAARD